MSSSSSFALRLATEPVVCVTLEQIARDGARRALQKAIEDEVAEYIDAREHHVAERVLCTEDNLLMPEIPLEFP